MGRCVGGVGQDQHRASDCAVLDRRRAHDLYAHKDQLRKHGSVRPGRGTQRDEVPRLLKREARPIWIGAFNAAGATAGNSR
jgi:hypothetical protein